MTGATFKFIKYNNINDVVVYDSSTKSCRKISSIGITSGTKLYVNIINGKTDISNTHCSYISAGGRKEYITLNGGNKTIDLQTFGTYIIDFGVDDVAWPSLGLGGEYDFILTNSTSNNYWDTSRIDYSTDYLVKAARHNYVTGDLFFSVNREKGVGYFHNGSSTTPNYTKNMIHLYIWRRRSDSNSGSDWKCCGYTIWDPVFTSCTISWWHVDDNGNPI